MNNYLISKKQDKAVWLRDVIRVINEKRESHENISKKLKTLTSHSSEEHNLNAECCAAIIRILKYYYNIK